MVDEKENLTKEQEFELKKIKIDSTFQMMKSLIAEIRFVDKTLIYGVGAYWSLILTNYKFIDSMLLFKFILSIPVIITMLLGIKTLVLLHDYFDLKSKYKEHLNEPEKNTFSLKIFLKKWGLFLAIYCGIGIFSIFIYCRAYDIYILL